jgi:C4-dicarboxylate transporter DctM subunit
MSTAAAMISCLILLIFFIISGPPIPLAFAGAIIYLVLVMNVDPRMLLSTGYGNVKAYILVALPLFIVAGGVMSDGAIGDVLVRWLETFTQRIRGGLIIVAVAACALFGAVCGSGTATLTCIGTVLGPKLHDRKYPKGIYAAVLCCAAPLGLLIPPSGIQIIYAWACNVSVLGCFLAIVVPGIILCIFECIVAWLMVRKAPEIPPSVKMSFPKWGRNFGKTTIGAIPAILMPVIILGGIYSGIFTPTEAAGVSVVYAIIVGFLIYKRMTFKSLVKTFKDSAVTTGVMILLVFFATIFSRILIQEDMPKVILNALTSISDNKIVILIMVNIFMVILGMIADDTCGTLIAGPLLLPVVASLGVSPYHFAAILGVNLGMGNITPPCAPFLYLASRIFKVPVADMLPYVGKIILFAYVPTLILVTYIPQLSLWLPQLIMGDKFMLF